MRKTLNRIISDWIIRDNSGSQNLHIILKCRCIGAQEEEEEGKSMWANSSGYKA
jgi:hypothetical protein